MKLQIQTQSILDNLTVIDRAVIYARVSGDDRGKDGRNLASQLDMGREYATNKGYQIVEELAEDDRGASGAEVDLPQLNRVREMAHAGQFDVLIVRELDRLSRNLAKQLIVEEELNRAGVRVEYVLAEYDNTPEGKLSKLIRATIAEYEREKIQERTVRGKRNKVKSGNVSVARQAPFGYRLVDDGIYRQFEVEPAEAEIVRYIFEQFLNGLTIEAIRVKLNERGIPTPSDLRKFHGGGKQRVYGKWGRATVHGILSNSTYAGKWYFGKKKMKVYRKDNGKKGYTVIKNPPSHRIEVNVPVIISQEVFDVVQQKLAENKARRGKPGEAEILLRKRCTCEECGYKMNTLSPIKKRAGYYFCVTANKKDLAKTCTQKTFRADLVDAKVWNWIEEILTDPDRLEEELKNVEAKRKTNGAMLQSQIEAAESKMLEFSRELGETLSLLKDLKKGGHAYSVVLADIERLEEAISQLEVQRNKIKALLNQVTLSAEKIERLKEFAAKIAAGLEEARQDFSLRKAIIDLLDVQVRLIKQSSDGRAIAYVTCILCDTELVLFVTKSGDICY